MARLRRAEGAALAIAGLGVVLVPVALLVPHGSDAARPDRVAAVRPLDVPEPPPLGAVYARPLFAPALFANPKAALPEDAPVLAGIAGRLGHGAVAFATGADGETRELAPGDRIDGWRLVSLARDAAYFERGTRQVRVPLAGGPDQ